MNRKGREERKDSFLPFFVSIALLAVPRLCLFWSVMNCPECGAPDTACEIRFNECLVKEFEDTAYGAVHHLTVAAYMVQHSNKLTREGWLYERNLLKEFLVENKPPAFIRKQNKDLVDSGKRTFKIKSTDGKAVISKNTWTKTILDIRMDNAEVYCKDVTAWARSVLEESEEIVLSSSYNLSVEGGKDYEKQS